MYKYVFFIIKRLHCTKRGVTLFNNYNNAVTHLAGR